MSVIRIVDELKSEFVTIPNKFARDPRISHLGFRLFVNLRSHRSDFDVTFAVLTQQTGMKRDAIRSAIKNLKETGWLDTYQDKSIPGHYPPMTWILKDGLPGVDCPPTATPPAETSDAYEVTPIEEQESKKTNKEEQSKEPSAKSKRASKIDPNFTPQSFESNQRENPQVDLEQIRADFISYWAASGGKKIDWEATWRNNLRKVKDWPQFQKPKSSAWDAIEESK